MFIVSFSLLSKDFPDNVLKQIDADLKNIKLDPQKKESVEIELRCNEKDINNDFTEENINKFVKALDEILKKYQFNDQKILSLNNSKSALDEKILLLLLKNQQFHQYLKDEAFAELCIQTESTVDFILQSPQRHRLEHINSGVDKQTFTNSCAARSILKVLVEAGIVDKQKNNAAMELEIYKNIWSEVGGVANPERLIAYLNTFNTKVTGIAIDKLVDDTLANTKDVSLHMGFGIFRHKTPNIRHKKLPHEYTLPPNTFALAMVSSQFTEGGHLVFCKSLSNSQLEVTNPYDGSVKTYDSYTQFAEAEEGLGVIFELPLANMKTNVIDVESTVAKQIGP